MDWSPICAPEQQMIRDWADAQAAQQREVQRLLQRIAHEDQKV